MSPVDADHDARQRTQPFKCSWTQNSPVGRRHDDDDIAGTSELVLHERGAQQLAELTVGQVQHVDAVTVAARRHGLPALDRGRTGRGLGGERCDGAHRTAGSPAARTAGAARGTRRAHRSSTRRRCAPASRRARRAPRLHPSRRHELRRVHPTPPSSRRLGGGHPVSAMTTSTRYRPGSSSTSRRGRHGWRSRRRPRNTRSSTSSPEACCSAFLLRRSAAWSRRLARQPLLSRHALRLERCHSQWRAAGGRSVLAVGGASLFAPARNATALVSSRSSQCTVPTRRAAGRLRSSIS